MSDIVERLRATARVFSHKHGAIDDEAADEIERLRHELAVDKSTIRILAAQMDGNTDVAWEETKRLRTEVAELKRHLEYVKRTGG